MEEALEMLSIQSYCVAIGMNQYSHNVNHPRVILVFSKRQDNVIKTFFRQERPTIRHRQSVASTRRDEIKDYAFPDPGQ